MAGEADVPETIVNINGQPMRLYRLPNGMWLSKPMADLAAMFARIAPEFRQVSPHEFIELIANPETASELWQRLQPGSAPVAIDEAMSPPVFKVGDVVQLQSGGTRMTVVGAACCGCLDLAYGIGGIEEISLPRAAVKHYDPLAADGPDIPF